MTRADQAHAVAVRWLAAYSGHTRTAYGRDLAAWATFAAEHSIDVLAAPRSAVDAWARTMSEHEGRAPSTVARRLAAVSGFYAYAESEGVIDRSPVTHVRRPKVGSDSQTLGLSRARPGEPAVAHRCPGG
jgi:site-specific recombinase XerD